MTKFEIYKKFHEVQRYEALKSNGICIYSNKEIIKLICRGFSTEQILDFGIEQYYYWDVPSYWETKREGAN
tara:strand:+ start:65 stop:277 length:213 start_codon:yes stop_codon:yes gene_type:complete